MHSRRLTILLPLLVVVTMLASLITPAPVLAAGEPPPPPREKSPKAQPAPAKPAPPASPAGASYTAEMPAAAPDGAANAAAVALSVDAIAQAGAVLIGPGGSPMPMAARDTVNVLVAGGAIYFKGSGPSSECTAGYCYYDTIVQALAAFSSRSGSGTIYASGALNETTPVDVNGATLNLSKLTGLAWDGEESYSPWITGGLLTIQNMLKGFTVDGFYISKGIDAHDNAGTLRFQNLYVSNPNGAGIFVNNHIGNIDLFNVTISGANGLGSAGTKDYGDGAYLDNTKGTGNVTISNSSFNGNVYYGVQVITNGSVLLNRVEANGNQNYDGANLNVKKGATVKDSRFDKNQNFSSGLVIQGQGAINLQNVEANGNDSYGIKLVVANDITLNGGLLTGNHNPGLSAHTAGGNITLNNLQALGNDGGVEADNSSAAAKTVTVTNSIFNDSPVGNGLLVKSKGSVILNHIDVENNGANGVKIDNTMGSGSVSLLSTLGLNLFYNNPGNALAVKSNGAISLNGSSFIANYFGVVLDNSSAAAKTVTVTHSSFNNTSNAAAVGLEVLSKGNITLNAVQANSNAGEQTYGTMGDNVSGILLDNCAYDDVVTHACAGSGTVSVLSSLGASQASNNAQGDGLFILSKGAVTVSGFSSTLNGGGAFIDNVAGASTLTLTNSTFSNNTGTQGGLRAYSTKAITLTGVEASQNSGWAGAIVANTWGPTTTDTVTISKSHFDHNKNYGLEAFAKGNLTVNNLSANLNNGTGSSFGAFLQSDYGGVTIQDTLGANQFSFNNGTGLNVSAGGGAISASGVTASHNSGGNGITLDNSKAAAKTVTAQRILAATNGVDGLDVKSKGSVTLNAVQANSNAAGNGVTIDNCSYDGAICKGSGSVSILSTLGPNSMSYNKYGLWIDSGGSVPVNGTTASNNTGSVPVRIRNYYTLGKTVTVNQSNFNANAAAGLYIQSAGVITLNNISANDNLGANGNGVDLENAGFIGSPGVNILSTSGNNQFNGNARIGLNVNSSGSISLSKVLASENGSGGPSSGAVLKTGGASSISITCSAFNHNAKYGLEVDMGTGTGMLTFKGVAANHNLGLYDLDLSKAPVMSWTVCGQ